MTKYILTSLLGITLLLSSCGKITQNGEIVRDCTGTYLQLNNRDYLICNPSMVSSQPSGSHVKVKFRHLGKCSGNSDQAICEMYHHSYGFVEISEIK